MVILLLYHIPLLTRLPYVECYYDPSLLDVHSTAYLKSSHTSVDSSQVQHYFESDTEVGFLHQLNRSVSTL